MGSGVALDVCPTSNVRTSLASSVAAHPLRALHEAGVRVMVSSDDPLPFATTVTEELAHLHRDLGFSLPDLGRFIVTAAAHSFQSAPARSALVRTLQAASCIHGRLTAARCGEREEVIHAEPIPRYGPIP